MKFALLLSVAVQMSFSGAAQSQVQEFWNATKFRRDLGSLPSGVNAWLFELAKRVMEEPTYTDVLGKLEGMDKDKTFQNQVFFEVYVGWSKNKEGMRMFLNEMCGSQALANSVSEHIITRFQNDKEALAVIKSRQQQKQSDELAKREREKADEEMGQKLAEQEQIAREEQRQNRRWSDSLRKRASAFIQGNIVDEAFDAPPFFKCEAGIHNKWNVYQEKFLQYPKDDRLGGYAEVFISFIVDETGKVGSPKVLKGVRDDYDALAIDLIESTSGKWKPARKGRKRVSCEVVSCVFFAANR